MICICTGSLDFLTTFSYESQSEFPIALVITASQERKVPPESYCTVSFYKNLFLVWKEEFMLAKLLLNGPTFF
jgi:hypothetical protein